MSIAKQVEGPDGKIHINIQDDNGGEVTLSKFQLIAVLGDGLNEIVLQSIIEELCDY